VAALPERLLSLLLLVLLLVLGESSLREDSRSVALTLLMDVTEEQELRSEAPCEAETFGDAADDDSRQLMRTFSPLRRSLREAAALASTLNVRESLLAEAPDARTVRVWELASAETTSAVSSLAEVEAEPVAPRELDADADGLLAEADVDGLAP